MQNKHESHLLVDDVPSLLQAGMRNTQTTHTHRSNNTKNNKCRRHLMKLLDKKIKKDSTCVRRRLFLLFSQLNSLLHSGLCWALPPCQICPGLPNHPTRSRCHCPNAERKENRETHTYNPPTHPPTHHTHAHTHAEQNRAAHQQHEQSHTSRTESSPNPDNTPHQTTQIIK